MTKTSKHENKSEKDKDTNDTCKRYSFSDGDPGFNGQDYAEYLLKNDYENEISTATSENGTKSVKLMGVERDNSNVEDCNLVQESEYKNDKDEIQDLNINIPDYDRDMIPRLQKMLSVRDAVLKDKQQEIDIIQTSNAALRTSIDQAEAQVESLRKIVSDKDTFIRHNIKEKKKLEKIIKELQTEKAQSKGQQHAIDVSTKQNKKLLLLLRDEENKFEKLQEEHDIKAANIEILREKLSNSTKEFAAIECELKQKCTDLKKEATKKSRAYNRIYREYNELQCKHEEESNLLSAKCEELRKKLDKSLAQPYKLLDRLQLAEDEKNKVFDYMETINEEIDAMNERNEELSTHLEESINRGNSFKKRMEFLQENFPPLEKEIKHLRTRLDEERLDKHGLEKQLYEMSCQITELVEREQDLTEKEAKKSLQVKAVESEKLNLGNDLAKENRQISRSLHKANSRISVLETEIENYKLKIKRMAKELNSPAHDPLLGAKYESSQAARKKLLNIYTHQYFNITTVGITHFLKDVNFNTMALTDEDLKPILETFKKVPSLRTIDISSNTITDSSCIEFSEFFRSNTCWVTKVDLKVNRISKQGIRRIATVLEKCSHRNFGNIILSKEGIVEAKNRPKSAATAHSTTSQNDGKQDQMDVENIIEDDKMKKFSTYSIKQAILTVDIRYNTVSPPGTDVPPPCAFVETMNDITTKENAKVRPLTELEKAEKLNKELKKQRQARAEFTASAYKMPHPKSIK